MTLDKHNATISMSESTGCSGRSRAVVVTAFFYAPTPLRDSDFYMSHATSTLSAPCTMVIFCNSACRAQIQEIRTSQRPEHITHLVEMDMLADPESQAIASIITSSRESKKHIYTGSRNTAQYMTVQAFKWKAILLASRIVTEASHYIWVDFAGGHVIRDLSAHLPTIVTHPRPKIAMCCIRYQPPLATEHPDFTAHCYMLPCFAAGLFSVQASMVSEFYANCQSIFFEQLAQGTLHTEQMVFAVLYNRNPDLFSVYFGDYHSMASNYILGNYDYADIITTIGECIEPAIAANNPTFALLASRSVLQATTPITDPVVRDHLFRLIALAQRMLRESA